ncbi:MAG TPA: nitroreductase family deazaflavin-dependent oxidoreductase [Actinospica sp.]|jgi:deazaflavin-dependent oxidoreductase (nitroreductase family)|nr:nitroreductase family deazaflavin-dependent oxidoreductase [Actinospica sp.]
MRITRWIPKRVLGNPLVSALSRRVFPRADKAIQRATHGRRSLAGAFGMPLMLLETTGRRSGALRVTPLTFATSPSSTDFLVVGSNWGQPSQPAWSFNLRANPEAVVVLNAERIPVRARLLTGDERTAAWSQLLDIWPAYDEYDRRVRATSGREIMVFRLERT